jgi:hypothetical protein
MKHVGKPESLEDLLAQAERYADFSMRQVGRVPPTMMAVGPEGPLFYIPETMGSERAKDSFANTARLICVAYNATAVVLILESWMRVAAPGESLDIKERPSEAIDRKEVVLLIGEKQGYQKPKFLPIIRTDAGGFFGFGDSNLPEYDNFQGRFAGILPSKKVKAKERAKARALLDAMGLGHPSLSGRPEAN